ncbi:hypothetical protein Aave_1334 [Paracidovorax citrulli AAC00-1]|uniref:Uncharacterized protein n=1 Tax=Paracidovorax citrulli (strain AAC00-1) TaxID=397945 RepID=A1TLT7_PARC0|nr:hypothetical protein Aave_1334 [Paracidovorax citrulli AAC00-1]
MRRHKKSPVLAVRGFRAGPFAAGWWPGGERRYGSLLGGGSTTCSSSCSGVCSGLGGIAGGSGGFGSSGCGRSRSVGSRSFGRCGHGSGSRGRSFDGSRGRSRGFFLLAAGGESDGRDQGSQNERVLHFGFFLWDRRILEFCRHAALFQRCALAGRGAPRGAWSARSAPRHQSQIIGRLRQS